MGIIQVRNQNQDHHLNDVIHYKAGSTSSLTQKQNKIESKQLGTKYNAFLTEQGNILWAGAVNLAFSDFKKNYLNQKNLSFAQAGKQTVRLLSVLNKPRFTKSNVRQSAIYVSSGIGNQAIKKINQQVIQKFPYKTTPPLKEDSHDDDCISYAYLLKALAYEHEFQRQAGVLWFGNPLPGKPEEDPYLVQAFAAISKQCLNQIKIIEFTDKRNFFLGFKSKQMQLKNIINQDVNQNKQQQHKSWFDSIREAFFNLFSSTKSQEEFNLNNDADVIYIFSSQNQNQTVDSVIQKVIKAQKQMSIGERKSTEKLVEFIMPVIDLEVKHQYEQLKGLQILNPQMKGKKIKIIQNIKLRMDQKGVVVQNDALMGKDECAIMGNVEIAIRHPFWLVLTQQGKHPYIAVKINYLPKKDLIITF